MKTFNTYRLLIILSIGLLYFLFTQSSALNHHLDYHWNAPKSNTTSYVNTVKEKQKGAHVFGIVDSTNYQLLTRNNIEWITLVAWGFQRNYDSPTVRHHNGDSTMIRQDNSNWLKQMELAHSLGFKLFVKPHVWISNHSEGKWRSDIYPTNDKNWELWKKSYTNFILRYAKLAQQAHAEMFCIGTEFSRLSVEKPLFWKKLIQDVKRIYFGKITYAANWYNEYEEIVFWKDLDYIGIQAYFPLTKSESPSVKHISQGWNDYLPTIQAVHKKYNRKVLFTEIGYKSTTDSAIDPWAWVNDPSSTDKLLSTETQANCYTAFFNTIWAKEWFAGAHIWQLRSDYKKNNKSVKNLDFTPLGKPAETIIAKGFE